MREGFSPSSAPGNYRINLELGVFLKNRNWLFVFLFLVLSTLLFAGGNAEETKVQTQNDEWILCVTDFDLSSLPVEKHAIASVITRKVVERLGAINYRARVSEEYAYYEESAWNISRTNAAKALAAKREERSLLIFRGEAQWRYAQNLARLDAEIERLVSALEAADNNRPNINREPLFGLTRANLDFSFPAAPRAGNENKFCLDQKADAMLAGSVTDFYGRYVVSLKLYTVYTRSFVWEDSVIFSVEDIEGALDEITQKLMITLGGNDPATLFITTQPEDALVLINRSFVNRSDSSSLEYPAGTVTVTASAPNHESVSFETDLSPGEHTRLSINLKPVDFVDVEIDGFPMPGSVYNGALYMGESPLTIRLPANKMEYLELETLDSQKGTIVFRTPDSGDFSSLSLRAGIPVEEGRVERMRSLYYQSWGATWITGIAAWIAYHSYISSDNALRYNSFNQGLYESNKTMYYVSMGTMIAVGIVAVLDVIQMIRYIYNADRGATPIARPGGY